MADREEFLVKFNNAFVENDLNFIFDSVTTNVKWQMVGDPLLIGKEALIEAMNKVKQPKDMELNITSMIISGNAAAVDGTMHMKDDSNVEKKYSFCDLFKFSTTEENKIEEMKSYIINISDFPDEKSKS